MRLATIELPVDDNVDVRVAALADDGHTLHLLDPGTRLETLVGGGLPALLDAGDRALATPAAASLDTVRLLPPLHPPALRDFVAFEEHVEGVVRSVTGTGTVVDEWYAAPTFYFTNPHTLIGAADPVEIPPGCQALDFELEVAAVIGVGGRNLDVAAARDAIVGYTIMNDWSARDLQRAEMKVGLGPAKGKDFASTLGPWLVTADEVEASHDGDGFLDLRMTVTVNDRLVGWDNLANMSWTFAELAAYASRGSVLHPGDVLASGTCGNGGCLAELWGRNGVIDPPTLRSGDAVTMTVDGLGMLRNTVIRGGDAHPIPPARRRSPSARSARRSWR